MQIKDFENLKNEEKIDDLGIFNYSLVLYVNGFIEKEQIFNIIDCLQLHPHPFAVEELCKDIKTIDYSKVSDLVIDKTNYLDAKDHTYLTSEQEIIEDFLYKEKGIIVQTFAGDPLIIYKNQKDSIINEYKKNSPRGTSLFFNDAFLLKILLNTDLTNQKQKIKICEILNSGYGSMNDFIFRNKALLYLRNNIQDLYESEENEYVLFDNTDPKEKIKSIKSNIEYDVENYNVIIESEIRYMFSFVNIPRKEKEKEIKKILNHYRKKGVNIK